MHKRCVLSILSAMAIFVVSCAPSVSRSGDYGKILIAVGGSMARELETGWPGGTIPTFSSITVTVSGSDMSTVTTSSSGSSGSLTIQVPAGTNRLVEVMAVPAAGGGAPYFALGYAGSATVDLSAGETVNVPIRLAIAKTKIVLPSYAADTIFVADSFTGDLTAFAELNEPEDFEFDQYGRLYVANGGETGIYRFTDAGTHDLLPGSPEYGNSSTSLTYDAARNRLYALWNQDGAYTWYTDLSDATLTAISISSSPSYNYYSSNYSYKGFAVDATGYLYLPAYDDASSSSVITKIALNGTEASVIEPPTRYADIGLLEGSRELTVNDMVVRDGVLYIAAYQSISNNMQQYSATLFSRGKVIAIDTSTMTKLWDAGWSDTGTYPSDPATQFYGPRKFVGIAPKKFYIADEGFSWDGVSYDHLVNVDRVVELDLERQAITGTRLLDTTVALFDDYSDSYAVSGC